MRIKLLIVLSVVVLFASCKKDGGKSHVVVTVKSGSALANAPVSLLSKKEKYWSTDAKAKTDNNGQVSFDVIPGKTYALYHYEDDGLAVDPTSTSLIVIGTFSSQQEINNSPPQTPAATVGGDHYQDINGDGKIDRDDRVVTFTAPQSGKTISIDFPLVVR